MIQHEGRGFLVRTAADGPWGGWVGSRFLEEGLASAQVAPGRALHRLMRLAAFCPGGFALIWDHPPAWMEALPAESRQGWWEALGGIPGLSLHLPSLPPELPGGDFRAWLHAPEAPAGPAGEAWRQGWVGWVPDAAGRWSLPGLGSCAAPAGEEVQPGWTWGELLIPLSALSALDLEQELLPLLGESQARLEKALAQRMAMGAFPELPFARRAAAWRVGLLGGAEFLRGHGDADKAAQALKALAEALRKALRTPVLLGSSQDFEAASTLGRQAMRDASPWRLSLPLPPAPPSFTPGLCGDPRDPSPLPARALTPAPIAALLDHPAMSLLRVPAVAPEAGVGALLSQLRPAPALRWLPPQLPPPGPFDPEHPWAAYGDYPFPADPRGGETPSLFDLETL